MQRGFNISESINITDDINRMKENILFPQMMKKLCLDGETLPN